MLNYQACSPKVSLCEQHFLSLSCCHLCCLLCGPSCLSVAIKSGNSAHITNLTICKLGIHKTYGEFLVNPRCRCCKSLLAAECNDHPLFLRTTDWDLALRGLSFTLKIRTLSQGAALPFRHSELRHCASPLSEWPGCHMRELLFLSWYLNILNVNVVHEIYAIAFIVYQVVDRHHVLFKMLLVWGSISTLFTDIVL